MPKIQVGIVGATGYTGSELVRILLNHPEIEISIITSESRAGEKFSDVHPFFRNLADFELVPAKEVSREKADVLFLALPHGVSMVYIEKFYDKDFKFIDLSGDYRLSGPDVYESWYPKEHTFPKAFKDAVYGLPELHRDEIANSNLVANPGCYPTSAILGLAPLVRENVIKPGTVVIDSKSGVTGAGNKAGITSHFPNVNDNFGAYGIKTHRHSIEIEEQLNGLTSHKGNFQFTPHLLPVDRGILSSMYMDASYAVDDRTLAEIFSSYYGEEPFIRLRSTPPKIKDVRGTNYCDIYCTYDERTNRILVVSVIDNLVKGAAGQAVQNMNLMLGLEEPTGLNQIPVNP